MGVKLVSAGVQRKQNPLVPILPAQINAVQPVTNYVLFRAFFFFFKYFLISEPSYEVKYGMFKAVKLNTNTVFQDVSPCSATCSYDRFGGINYLHLQSR
jgi:hypothetical protein